MNYSFRKIFREHKEISVRYDREHQAIWCYFNPQPRPCFSTVMLKELRQLQQSIMDYFHPENRAAQYPVRYFVIASQSPGVFNFGGDLNLFIQLIADRQREQLLEYAKSCIDICYHNAVSYHLPLTTIALVEGSALGGGFEAALSSNVLIAERQAEMGLPEARFNLFPGMGAYSFLARALGMNAAEGIIASGKIYNAGDLHDMGLVTELAETGRGYETVNKYIKRHMRSCNSLQAIQAVRRFYSPVSYDELFGITKIWVDAALRLERKDLLKMERFVKAQNSRTHMPDSSEGVSRIVRTRQDRRFDSESVSFPFIDRSGQTVLCDRRDPADRRLLGFNSETRNVQQLVRMMDGQNDDAIRSGRQFPQVAACASIN